MRFDHTVSDRMQVVGRGDLRPPGTCLHCGSGNCEEGYVDLDRFIDYEGDSYLCMTCVRQMIEMVDGCLPEDFMRLMQEKLELEVALNTTSERLSDANERLAVYDSVLANAVASVTADDSSDTSDSVQSESEVLKADGQLELPIITGEPESEESIEVERPDESNGDAASDTRTRRSFSL